MDKKFLVIFRSLSNFPNNRLENLLKKLDYKIITFPILTVENIYSKPINTLNAQAVLVTSANGLFILSRLSNNKKIRIFTVGSDTKRLAHLLGYKNVIDCNGDSVKMYDKVVENTIKEKGVLIYVGAEDISTDLPSMLRNIGYKIKRYTVYRTREIKVIDKGFLNIVESKKLAWVVLLSNKGAANFYRLMEKYFSLNYFSNVKFACLSKNISKKLPNSIKNKFFSEEPSLESLKNIILKNE